MSNKAPRLRTLLALSASALTLSAISAPAHAQETESFQIEELVVTGSRGPADRSGVIVAERDPKSRASISEEFIQLLVRAKKDPTIQVMKKMERRLDGFSHSTVTSFRFFFGKCP